MEAKELRIGNLVKEHHGGKYVKINHKDLSDIATGKYPVEPIELTPKWLEKLGFEKTDDYGDQIYYEPKNRGKRHYYICFDHDDISFGLSVFGNCTSLIYDDKNLQYVHQFQNLYYALTGVELSVS